jgi:hypothetical protein
MFKFRPPTKSFKELSERSPTPQIVAALLIIVILLIVYSLVRPLL